MPRMTRILIFAFGGLTALLVPGSLVLLALWKLVGRLRLRPDLPLPLHNQDGAILFTRRDWERLMARTKPIRWAITRLYDWPERRRVAKLTKMTHRDVVLVLPFRALADWVEQNYERVWAPVPWTADPLYDRYWAAMAEIQSLYVWWFERDGRVRGLDTDDPGVREYNVEALREEDQLMLARLVNVRNYLGDT